MADDTPDIAQVSDKNTTGTIDPSIWDEAEAVTGRPVKQPAPNTTFAERAKAQSKPAKADDDAEPKPAAKKTTSRKRK